MNTQKLDESLNSKGYPYPVQEPGVMCGTDASTLTFEEDFEWGLANAITMDELRQYLYDVIDSFPWKDR